MFWLSYKHVYNGIICITLVTLTTAIRSEQFKKTLKTQKYIAPLFTCRMCSFLLKLQFYYITTALILKITSKG